MSDAPKKIWTWPGANGSARMWSETRYPDQVAEYILASEHARIVAEKDAEIARLLKAISAIATWMDDPEWRDHIGAVRGARSIARTAAIRALKESPDA